MKVIYPLALVMAAAALVSSTVAVRASDTDDRIESSFKNSYVYKTYLKDEKISISSKDGAVTLSGVVWNDSHKPMAQDVAEALPGVKSVDNRIERKSDSPAENTDAWVSMKVKTALVFHRNVNAHKTDVYVKDSIVTLKGEAASQAQKDLTTEFAKDVAGVKGVVNEMTVAKTPPAPGATMGESIDDASITAQVKTTLLLHRSTGVLRTKVETTNGVVTVSGTARNSAEKDLVTKIIQDVYGVKKVVNDMTIEKAMNQ